MATKKRPSKIKPDDVVKRLEEMNTRFDTQLVLIARQVRKSHVVPICDKYELTFFQDRTGQTFSRDAEPAFCIQAGWELQGVSLTRSKVPKNMHRELLKAYALLDIEVRHGVLLGDFVNNYKPKPRYP